MREREVGATRVHIRNGGGYWVLPLDEYDSVLRAWMKGEAFWSGIGFYGAQLTIKLGECHGIERATPESIKLGIEERQADAKEDAINE